MDRIDRLTYAMMTTERLLEDYNWTLGERQIHSSPGDIYAEDLGRRLCDIETTLSKRGLTEDKLRIRYYINFVLAELCVALSVFFGIMTLYTTHQDNGITLASLVYTVLALGPIFLREMFHEKTKLYCTWA